MGVIPYRPPPRTETVKMPFTDDELKQLRETWSGATLDALKQYDAERAEYEANLAAQQGKGGNSNDNTDNKPAPGFAERLLGGSKAGKS
jgi:hypothetical protein